METIAGRARPEQVAGGSAGRPAPRVLIAHPSPDLYGSDRLMLSSAEGLQRAGWQVTVTAPSQGPLLELLAAIPGLTVRVAPFPVLRKAYLSPLGLVRLAVALPVAVLRMLRMIRAVRPDVVYVNTVTIPWWVLAARLARVPVVVHVREAEESWPRLVRTLLNAPLLLASSVVVNSRASLQVLLASVSRVAGKSSVIYNGLAGPEAVSPLPQPGAGRPARLALVARLSPRKGVDVALDAVGLLRSKGYDVELDICGTAYAGYEWYERELRERAAQPDLTGAVRFLGYVNPTWPVLAESSAVLVPSRVEPFGNTAVEAMLAHRPLIASSVQGLTEIVTDGRTGLLVPPDDVTALADAIRRLLDDPELAAEVAARGRAEALDRFSLARYRYDIRREIELSTAGARAA